VDFNSAARVLLIEDNEDIREGLSILLESEGYDIVAAGSAEDGLAILRKQAFDLVITDYMLPGESGGWMVEQARRESCLGEARVVMITAHPRVVPPAGVRILHKPLDVDDFLRMVMEESQARANRMARTG
jgi:CheY-like chemotaxis protein